MHAGADVKHASVASEHAEDIIRVRKKAAKHARDLLRVARFEAHARRGRLVAASLAGVRHAHSSMAGRCSRCVPTLSDARERAAAAASRQHVVRRTPRRVRAR
jgi:hypothetical protein